MEQCRTYQWMWFSPDRRQQYVVRCEAFADFLEALELVRTLLPIEESQAGNGKTPVGQPLQPLPPEAFCEPEATEPLCPIHGEAMKQRRAKNGSTWWDHRWKDGEVWFRCNGERVKEG